MVARDQNSGWYEIKWWVVVWFVWCIYKLVVTELSGGGIDRLVVINWWLEIRWWVVVWFVWW